jgi:hypothetical protein
MKVIFCHSCGTEISESSLFCSNCGEKKLLVSLDKYEEKQLGSNLIQSELYGQTTNSIINSFSNEGATKPSIESFPEPQKKVLFPFIFIGIFFLFGIFTFLNKTNSVDKSNVSPIQNVDVCRCLIESGTSSYMMENGKACDKAISNAIGVEDWGKINMSQNPIISKRFDELANRCR